MHKEISILKNNVSCYGNVYEDNRLVNRSEENLRRLLVVSYLSSRDNPDYHNGRIHLSQYNSVGEYKNDRFIRLKVKE